MKKLISVLLVLVMVCALCVSAYASGVASPTQGETSTDTTAALPEMPEAADLGIYNMETDELEVTVPKEEVKMAPVGQADTLENEEDTAKFLEEYEKVKEIKDKVVKYFFWLQIPEQYEVNGEHYAKFFFTCKGTNIQVTVNGEEMEVVPVEDQADTFFAKLTQLGAVAILCDAEA